MAVIDRPTPEADPLQGLQIIDADAHLTEPPDLWSARVPKSMQGQVPQMKTIEGNSAWFVNDQPWASTGGNTIATNGRKVLGSHVIQPFEDIDPATWEVDARLAIMDKMGVWAQILYPNGIGFASNHIFAIEDVDQRANVLSVYNDFLIDVQKQSSGRLLPQGILPVWDMEFTVREMGRLIDQGMSGFTLSDKPELLGLPELPEPYFEPMWDVFNQSGVVANFHIGAGGRREDFEATRRTPLLYGKQTFDQTPIPPGEAPAAVANVWRSFGKQRRLAVHAVQMYMSNVRIIANLCMSDLFDRYPRLKIVSAESGIGWIPFILEALEYQFDEMLTEDAELNMAARRPSEYFNDHLWVMFWFEESAALKLIEDIGSHKVMIETDIPHPTCLYPGAREHFGEVLRGLDSADLRKVVQENAAGLYNIDVPA